MRDENLGGIHARGERRALGVPLVRSVGRAAELRERVVDMKERCVVVAARERAFGTPFGLRAGRRDGASAAPLTVAEYTAMAGAYGSAPAVSSPTARVYTAC